MVSAWGGSPLDIWVIRKTGSNLAVLRGITFGNGKFISVGNDGPYSSTDAINWSSFSWTSVQLNGIMYAGYFVAAGANGSIATYNVQQSTVSQYALNAVAAGGGLYVVVGQSGIYYSGSAITWQNAYGQDQGLYLNGVSYGNSKFVCVSSAVQEYGKYNSYVLSSANGSQWSKLPVIVTTPSPVNLYAVTFAAGQFVAVGAAGTVLTSSDGNSWTAQSSGVGNDLYGVGYGAGQFIAVGTGGTIVTSPNGVNWTVRNSGVANNLFAVSYGNEFFVAVGAGGLILSCDTTVLVPPIITTQPQDQAVYIGQNATYNVTATGTQPLYYQWCFNRTNIAGANANSYTVTSVQSTNAGNYTVVITNVTGAVTSTPALLTIYSGGILSLNGTNSYVSIPSSSDLQNTTEITVEAWVYPKPPHSNINGNYGFFIAKSDGQNATSQRSYEMNWGQVGNGEGIISSMFFNDGTWSEVWASLPETNWVHVAFTFSSTTGLLQLFTNGVLANTASGLAGKALRQTTLPLNLGGESIIQGPLFAAGFMDEVRIWNKARTRAEIAQSRFCYLTGSESNLVSYWNFDAGTAADLTGNGHDGVLNGGASIVPISGQDIVHQGICGPTIDTNNPTSSITSPTSAQNWSNAIFTVTGTASDDVAVANVFYSLNNSAWASATTTNDWSNWTATVNLIAGTNTIQAYAVDASGNISATNSVGFVAILSTVLTVNTNGSGTVNPNYNGLSLQVLAAYSMTATAGAGFSFTNWTGGISSPLAVLTNGATLQFVMQSNLVLQANFVDIQKPTNSITSPTPGQLWSNGVFTVTGKASDNVAVSNVWYSLNNTAWTNATTANNWTNWTATVNLIAGTNTIQAYAVDTSGNISATNSVSFNAVLSTMLTVGTNGLGSLNPNYNNAILQVGKGYSVAATAGTGFRFTNWTGGTSSPLVVLTNGATLQFVMQSNLVLQANFVDTNRPVLSITNLTAGQRWSNLVFTAKGTATDNWQVASVQVQLNGGVWTNATGTTNWSAPLTLTPGTNTLAAFATDTTGNNSPTNSVSWQYVVTNLLAVQATGLGTISPNYSNSWLEIGRNYSMTATPATGFVVTNWTISTNWLGGRVTNNATVQFMMASNLTLQVNFADVTKPTMTITAPTAGQKMTNALATFVGTASDNWKVAGVWYQLNSNTWNLVTATTNNYTNWTQTLPLIIGTNTLKAYALDLGGNFSTTNTLSVISSNTFMLQLAFTNSLPMTTNGLVFSLQLSKGLNGHIQVSTNLTSWLTLTNFVGSNATVTFRDPAATNSARRFYRAVIP